jgi:hypothetical protein
VQRFPQLNASTERSLAGFGLALSVFAAIMSVLLVPWQMRMINNGSPEQWMRIGSFPIWNQPKAQVIEPDALWDEVQIDWLMLGGQLCVALTCGCFMVRSLKTRSD